MHIYPIKPDEIFHYGIKEKSGRYPWGSEVLLMKNGEQQERDNSRRNPIL